MKKFLIQAGLLLLVFILAIFLFMGGGIGSIPFIPQKTETKQLILSSGAKINVEIADTEAKRKKGLGGRQSISSDEGMLFVFEQKGKYPFWMKGLSYSLDFIWIRDDKVVDIQENVQPPTPGQSDSSLPIYESKEEIDKVLEVSGGTAKRLNIKIGDSIQF